MADNPYSVAVPNVLQALMAGEQGYNNVRGVMKERATSQAREQAAQEMLAGGDPKSAIARLMSVGDIQGASTLANMGNIERDFSFRQQESQRAQSNADRSYGLQRDAANAGVIKTIKDANGNERLVRIDRNGNQTPIETGIPPVQQANPYAPGGKFTESQSKDALYASRMFASEKVLRDVEKVGTDWWERTKAGVSDKIGYNLRGPDFQKFDQAQRDFINATLRRESGAVIAESEFANANKQYFPQPGDTKEVIAQKRRNRQEAIKGIASGAGPSYRPDSVFADDGSIVPNPAPQGAAAPRGSATPQISEGATATNPQTGQKIMFKGGQWVPAQ